jgi:hypothetical protein
LPSSSQAPDNAVVVYNGDDYIDFFLPLPSPAGGGSGAGAGLATNSSCADVDDYGQDSIVVRGFVCARIVFHYCFIPCCSCGSCFC